MQFAINSETICGLHVILFAGMEMRGTGGGGGRGSACWNRGGGGADPTTADGTNN